MLKKSRLLLLLALCGLLSLTGCRKKADETESETQTVSETESESETEKKTEKTTEKETVKTAAGTEKKTTIKASTTKPSTTTKNTAAQTETTAQTDAASYGTEQCPYCYQQISTAPNGDGTTVYSVHVAQEKAWADTYGYGDTPPVNQQTDAPQTNAPQTDAPTDPVDDSQQCGYCHQWFTVSDGSYAAHIAAENAELGNPQGTEYIQCPICGYSFPKGSLYDNHVCITN